MMSTDRPDNAASAIYAFLDTNIFIRVATQGRPGCERSQFDDLRTLSESGAFKMLLPEVVALEVEKAFHSLTKELESSCDKLSDSIAKATQGVWNEIEGVKSEIQSHIKRIKDERIKECDAAARSIMTFLKSDFVTNIPLTPDIMVRAKLRHIAGRMPTCRSSSDQDALIIESLASHFGNSGVSPKTLFFCSENVSDFALLLNPKDLDRRYVLHPLIQKDFPHTYFSTSLETMFSVSKGIEHLPEPTNEEIAAALKKRDSDFERILDDDEYFESERSLLKALNRGYTQQFSDEILPTLPPEIQALRDRLAHEAMEMLSRCRDCTSWSERSESNLPKWIDFVDETMIPYVSLPRLIRIKNSIAQYLEIHKNMGTDVPRADS